MNLYGAMFQSYILELTTTFPQLTASLLRVQIIILLCHALERSRQTQTDMLVECLAIARVLIA